jgi:diguanylate cyclase (GGDEF)-like protein
MKYLKYSLSKFKNDALSKVFYDIMKYTFITLIAFLGLWFIPKAKEALTKQVSLSIWSIILSSLILILLTLLIAYFQFYKKFKKIQSESQIDELTGLKNYKAKNIHLTNLEIERNSSSEPISLILIDIDNFKKFNEKNSYEIADRILAKVGNLLNKDSRITDETYRYFMRGDEFLIIAKQTNIASAKLASERKRELIQDSIFNINEMNFKLTVSCGVTEFNKGETKEIVLERLNKALQAAKKKKGKNSTEILV